MQTIVWEVECLSCVKVRRHCKKCGGKTEFVSSGLFRVNANKKRLDVWLVYRCACCGASWNLPLYERVSPGNLPKAALDGYLQNAPLLARRHAMDTALLARHGCEVQPPEVAVAGPDVPAGHPVRVVIKSPAPLALRVAALLRQKLGLSAGALDALLQNGAIRLEGGRDVRRQKLGQEASLLVHLPPETEVATGKPPQPRTRPKPVQAIWLRFPRGAAAQSHSVQAALQWKQFANRRPGFPARRQLPHARC